jgi:ABC-type amino acid transport substrate-binding protein
MKLPQILLIIILSAVTAIAAVKLVPSQGVPGVMAAKETAFNRVVRTNTLRCGYIVWPPTFNKDSATGQMSGMAYDIMIEAAHRLGLKIDWVEEVTFATASEGLKSARYDAICYPVYNSSTRARVSELSTPLYYAGSASYVRPDDNRFTSNNVDAFNSPDVTIAVIDGEKSSVIAGSMFPKAKLLSLPQTSTAADALISVAAKKADVTFINTIAAAIFEKNNPGKIKSLDPQHPIAQFGNSFAYEKGEIELKNMFDIVFGEMLSQGVVDKIMASYSLPPGSYYVVAKPYAAPDK